MLNKKSFDLNKDENQAKTKEKLYQPRKFCWCKYIVPPLLIGFILLLILPNINFTGEAHNPKTSKQQKNSRMFSGDNFIMGKLQSTQSRALNCIQSTDSCSLTCVGGNINNVYKQLDLLYKSCNRDVDLVLIDCSFPANRLKDDFFQGNFRLRSVNISNCNLGFVQKNAFNQESVKNLKQLTLINTKFVTLDDNTFNGLQQLEHFELINKKSWSTFSGEGFLKYFAETLKTLILQQEADAEYVYDPVAWLQGAKMSRLTSVNLANNNFQNLLNYQTFLTLISVEYLDLSNCSLNYLAENVFDSVLQTLKYLNLSHNHLSSLSGEMLWQMTGVQLNLSFNFWQCTCENKEMLQLIKKNLLQQSNIKCYEPEEWKDRSIKDLDLECLQSTTLVLNELTTQGIGVQPKTTSESSRVISESSDAYSNDFSGQTSEENAKTSSETTTQSKPTTSRTTISMVPPSIPTSTTTRKPTTKIPEITTPIYCHVNHNEDPYKHPILKKKFDFSVLPHSATSVKIITDNFISSIGVIFFTTPTNYTILTNIQRHEFQYSAIINNLNSSANYVFCLVQDGEYYNWKISPFDCRSFSQPEMLPEAWLEKDDQVWIISIVVLGACLMVFLGIILLIIVMRYKKRNKRKRTLKEDVKMEVNFLEPTNDLFHQNFAVIVRPDVVAEHFNCTSNYDLYEELVM